LAVPNQTSSFAGGYWLLLDETSVARQMARRSSMPLAFMRRLRGKRSELQILGFHPRGAFFPLPVNIRISG